MLIRVCTVPVVRLFHPKTGRTDVSSTELTLVGLLVKGTVHHSYESVSRITKDLLIRLNFIVTVLVDSDSDSCKKGSI